MMHDQKVGPRFSCDALATWFLGALCAFSFACSSTADTRCNPRVDDCGGSGQSTATTTTGGAAGAGGTAGSTVASGTGGSGRAGAAGAGGAPMIDAGRTFQGKIVGYLPTWAGGFNTWARDLPWIRLSHLNIAFATPSGATFMLPDGQDPYL